VNHAFAWTCTVLVHRTVFDSVGMFEPGMKRAQDTDLWYRIAYQYPRVGYLPEPLAIYHLDTQGSSTKVNDSVDFMINLVHRHEAFSKQFNRDEAFGPCITHMLQVWIRQLQKQGRRKDAAMLLDKFSAYVSKRFCREMRFRLAVPVLGSGLVECVFWFKNKIKLR
ncbi:MAG: hypothetical protein ACYTEU_13140, partial [Planctomycetota bacterium]